jgi:hypothetical protein
MPYTITFKNGEEAFYSAVEKFGFTVMRELSGKTQGDGFENVVITLRKDRDLDIAHLPLEALGDEADDEAIPANDEERERRRLNHIKQYILEQLGADADDFKFGDSPSSRRMAKRILSRYELNGRSYDLTLSKQDQSLREEELERMENVREWREAYKTLNSIPVLNLQQNGFSRIQISQDRFALYAPLPQGFFKIDSQEYRDVNPSFLS